jgi:hypothetical protein
LNAPTIAVVLLVATAYPKSAEMAPSLAVSSVVWAHDVHEEAKRYAAPAVTVAPTSCWYAPTMAFAPLIDTEKPKRSARAASLAVSSCCCGHAAPFCAKTYAAPASLCALAVWNGAPTSAFEPFTETDVPNPSSAAPSLAVGSAVWLHVEPLSVKTYAAPASSFVPTVWNGAPTRAVVPLTETALPKASPAAVSPAESSGLCAHEGPAKT